MFGILPGGCKEESWDFLFEGALDHSSPEEFYTTVVNRLFRPLDGPGDDEDGSSSGESASDSDSSIDDDYDDDAPDDDDDDNGDNGDDEPQKNGKE